MIREVKLANITARRICLAVFYELSSVARDF